MNFQQFSNDTLQILDLEQAEKYNGRINIVQPPNPQLQFQMSEKIMIDNKGTDFRDALNGNLEQNLLAQVFFCGDNMQIIQNGIRGGVYDKSGGKYVVPNQNVNNLKIIMRSTYLQYAEHRNEDVTKQVEDLNQRVLGYCVDNVYSAAVGYEKYCFDQSSMFQPMELPHNHDRNFKQLELKPFV